MADETKILATASPVLPADGVFFSTSVWGQGELTIYNSSYDSWYADAEKTQLDVFDDNLCWAAAAGNLLLQCGYRDAFSDEDRILDLFSANWNNRTGWVEQALSWYFNGKGYYVTSPVPSGGNYFPELQAKSLITVVYGTGSNAAGVVDSLVRYLDAGYGVAINMQGALEHVVTIWGYQIENGVVRLYYSDSDDNKNNSCTDRRDALNMLRSTTLSYDAGNARWILDNLSGAYLYNFTALARYDAVLSGEVEGFDDAETLVIEDNAGVRRGNLDAAGDIDTYSFAASGASVTISVRPVPETFDGTLAWSVYAGSTLIFSSGSGNYGRFTWTVEGDANELHVVVGGSRDPTGGVGSSNYTLRVGIDADQTAPDAPLELAASRSGSVATLSWGEVTGMAYLVEYSTSSDFASGSVSQYFTSDTGIAFNFGDGRYYWRVAAIDDLNNLSVWTVAADALVVDTVAPGKVSGASGRQNGAEILFSWTAVSDFSGVSYELQYSTSVDFSGAVSVESTINALTLATWAGGSYYWRIRAVDGGGNAGSWSVTGTLAVDTVAPSQVAGLDAVSQSQCMNLSFAAVGDADLAYYELRYGNGSDLADPTTVRIGSATAYLTSAQSVGDFYFQVRAVDASGNTGDWSEIFQGEVLTSPPVVTVKTVNRVQTVNWSGTTGTGYQIDFGDYGSLYTEDTSFTLYNPGGTAGSWRIQVTDGEWREPVAFAVGSTGAAPQLIATADTASVILGRVGSEVWSEAYTLVNSFDSSEAAISLAGRLRSVDCYRGGEDYDILLFGDGGVTLILDDIYSGSALAGMASRFAGIEEIRGGEGDDVMDFTSNRWEADALTIYDGGGDDVIWCGRGDDRIMAGEGDDRYHGGGGDDLFAFGGNWGNDVVKSCDDGSITLLLTSGLNRDDLGIEQQGADLVISCGDNSIRVIDRTLDEVTLCIAASVESFRRVSTENALMLLA